MNYRQILIIWDNHWLDNQGKSKIPVNKTTGTKITVKKKQVIHILNKSP